jgi:hypothetical protein
LSEHHQIFIHPRLPVDQLIADITSACGVPLRAVEGGPIDYAAHLGHAAVEVELSHEYEEDRGMSFPSYDSLITVRDFDSDIGRQEETARRIFSGLASRQRYSLMLVLDLQQLIEKTTSNNGD